MNFCSIQISGDLGHPSQCLFLHPVVRVGMFMVAIILYICMQFPLSVYMGAIEPSFSDTFVIEVPVRG